MAEYVRTGIRRLAVRGYRSLRELEMRDLPEAIILYGPNGAGKSNILKAARLVLRAAALSSPVPRNRDCSIVLTLAEANQKLDLRPDDFSLGSLPEIRISLEISLGKKARDLLSAHDEIPLDRLSLDAVFQDSGDKTIRFWFDRADIDKSIILPSRPNTLSNSELILARLEQAYEELLQKVHENTKARDPSGNRGFSPDSLQPSIVELRTRLKSIHAASPSRDSGAQRVKTKQIREIERQIHEMEEAREAYVAMLGMSEKIAQQKALVSREALLADRAQRVLIPGLMQVSGAYRAPGSAEDPSGELYLAFLSEDDRVRDAALGLGRRLAEAGVFGPGLKSIEMIPVEATTFNEKQIRFKHPIHGTLPLRNLGTGQQQVVFMLGQRVITPYPIAVLEEPEAHLYKTLMETLARVLRASVAGTEGVPDVDQLWIATHHHYFALADHFWEVRLGPDGATQVEKKPRDEVAAHFFEPSPYWDTLELLVKEGMSPDVVIYRDPDGNVATAGDVLRSLHGDQILARRFVDAATKSFVLSLVQDEPEK